MVMRAEDETRVRMLLEEHFLCKKLGVRHAITNADHVYAFQMWKHEEEHYNEIRNEIEERILGHEQTR